MVLVVESEEIKEEVDVSQYGNLGLAEHLQEVGSNMHTDLVDGQAMELKNNPSCWFSCCDCGLTHLLVLTADDDGNPGLYVYGDTEETHRLRVTGKKKYVRNLTKLLEKIND